MTATANPIIPEAATRNERVKVVAREQGFALAPDIFASGTALYESNQFSRKREEIAKRTDAPLALENFRERIRKEHREDHDVTVKSLRMLPTGYISTDAGLILPESDAFKRLATFTLPPGASSFLPACEPALRATNANAFWQEGGYDNTLGAAMIDKEARVKLRVRNGGADRKLWAVTSPTYGRFDVDQVAALLAESLKAEAKAEVTYDGYRAVFDLSWVTPIEDPRLVGTGELFHAGVRISTADDASERLRVWALIERGLCRNFGIIDKSEQDVGSRIHRGNQFNKESIETLIQEAHAKIAPFVDAWIEAAKDKIFDGDEDARVKLQRFVDRGHLKIAGVDKQSVFNRVYSAWQKEPGYTRTSLVNALTRAAHESPWASPWQSQAVEQAAMQYVYVRDLALN
jgi:hypothetical protein